MARAASTLWGIIKEQPRWRRSLDQSFSFFFLLSLTYPGTVGIERREVYDLRQWAGGFCI
jgi:hypothetical protein